MQIDMLDSDYFDGSHYGIHAIGDLQKYGPRGFYQRHITHEHSDFGNKSFDIGTACHELVLRGDEAYRSRVITPPSTYPDTKTKKPKPWNGNATFCKEWKKDNSHKLILTLNEMIMIETMSESVHDDPTASEYFKHGHPEVGFRGKIDGLPVQCKADWIATDENNKITAIIDLKTCITLDDFLKSIHKYNYWRQAAHYTRVVANEIGRRVPFIFVAVEKNNPHRTGIYELDDDYIAEGDAMNKRDYKILGNYLESHGNRKPWPMEVKHIGCQTIEKPNWL